MENYNNKIKITKQLFSAYSNISSDNISVWLLKLYAHAG
jgi:hypothetical protein